MPFCCRRATSRGGICYSAGAMASKQQDREERRRSMAARIAALSTIITILPASMLAGWLLGNFVLDRLLRTFPWGSIVFTLVGAGAGFFQIIRILAPKRDNQE